MATVRTCRDVQHTSFGPSSQIQTTACRLPDRQLNMQEKTRSETPNTKQNAENVQRNMPL
jgi:hypothetical protein